MTTPVVIGDAASLGRDITPQHYAIGWQVSGLPSDAAAMDTYEVLLETSLRAVLRAIIIADAPAGSPVDSLNLSALEIVLTHTVGGVAVVHRVNLANLFPTVNPANIGISANDGSSQDFPHGDHIHRLPTRNVSGETPIIALEHLAPSPMGSRGTGLGFNATTGLPEYQVPSGGVQLSATDPEPVGGSSAPDAGDGLQASPYNHEHAVAPDSVGLTELKPAPRTADWGKVIGYDLTTGDPAVLDSGQSSFAALTDTAAALGSPGQSPVVDATGALLNFGGPFQPLATPAVPANVRAVDAFDGFLEVDWNSDPDATAYEYQRKATGASWPTDDGIRITATSIRNTTPLSLGDYDFRVRAVGAGGLLRSSWVEVLAIPIIATPTPGASSTHRLSRVRSQILSFAWNDLDVSNGGTGAARAVKGARYEYQYREATQLTWGAVVEHSDHTGHEIAGLTNGITYEARVRGIVRRSDGTLTDVNGPYSAPSNQEKPVKDTVTLTYGVADSRTGAITSPRTLELTPSNGAEIEITNPANPVATGQFYALDIGRGDEYARNYNIVSLETRPLPSDITAGADFVAETEPVSGPRRYSIGPAVAVTSVQRWLVEVN